jgi:hypothetical protein
MIHSEGESGFMDFAQYTSRLETSGLGFKRRLNGLGLTAKSESSSRQILMLCGLALLTVFTLRPAHAASRQSLINFTSAAAEGFWFPVTDAVRGGKSTIFMQVNRDQTATVSGELVLNESNAGFASYRVQREDGTNWNIGSAQALVIEARGDGREYKLLIEDKNSSSSRPKFTWQAAFVPPTNQFGEIEIQVDQLVPVSRGQVFVGAPTFDASNVMEIGFQINDKQNGPFRLDLKAVEVK